MSFSGPYSATFVDVSQFVAEPLRTGVQRVLMKVIEHLPRGRIMPFRVVDEHTAAILDPAIFDFGLRYFRQASATRRAMVAQAHGVAVADGEAEAHIRLVAAHPLAILPAADFFARARRVLNLEAFSRPARSQFYAGCPVEHRGRVIHFIHDLLLFEAPEVFPQLNWRYALDYVLLFEAYCAAGGFLVASEAMAEKVAHHFNRARQDVHVVPFGGDLAAASWRRPAPAGGRRRVVVLGTIEPRKYPLQVAQALFRLAAYHPDIECVLIGKWGWLDPLVRAEIETLLSQGRITHHETLPDSDVVDLMASADVGIYVSSHEGFGLPVVEFAALGVPVVSNAAVPSASLVAGDYARVLQTVDVRELVVATEALLAAPRPPGPYYAWRWADCAGELFAWRDGPDGEGGADAAGCWQAGARLARELRHRQAGEAEVRRYIEGETEILASSVDAMVEIVQGAMRRAQWTELVGVRELLACVARALAEDSPLDGMDGAYVGLVGRGIDAPQAAVAVRMQDAAARLACLAELAESAEAVAYLGGARAFCLRHVLGEIGDVVGICLAETVDLFGLNEWLGTPAPGVADIRLAEDMKRAGVDPLERMVFFTHARPRVGDALDLFLEEAAGVCWQRGLRIVGLDSAGALGRGAEGAAGSGAGGPSGDGERSLDASSPRSFMRQVAPQSGAFSEGWHAVEHARGRNFRWMMRVGRVENPEKSRPVSELILDVKAVYGAEEPHLNAWFGEQAATVDAEMKPDGDGWHVRLHSPPGGVVTRAVRLEALASGCPALAEGGTDRRELSICLAGATFVYQDKN